MLTHSITTIFPLYSDNECFWPWASTSVNAGAGLPITGPPGPGPVRPGSIASPVMTAMAAKGCIRVPPAKGVVDVLHVLVQKRIDSRYKDASAGPAVAQRTEPVGTSSRY